MQFHSSAPGISLSLLLALGSAACARETPSGSGTSVPAAKPLELAVIPKGTTHVFWKAVERGAREAGAKLGVDIQWKGPLQESDRAGQIQLVQQFIAQRVGGIALAPLDHKALAGPVAQARAAGVPVLIFDSALAGQPGVDFISLVATNNRQGGRMAGTELARLLGSAGKVVLLRYAVGSASTQEREEGFLEVVKQNPGLQCLVDNRYAGATAGEAKTEALNLLDQLQQAQGVFCSNESATHGMLLALRQAGLAGKLKFVGFDASPPLVEALVKGEIAALVVQNPTRMGRLAVETLAAHLRGEKVEPSIDTGAVLVTRENMKSPEIAALLQ